MFFSISYNIKTYSGNPCSAMFYANLPLFLPFQHLNVFDYINKTYRSFHTPDNKLLILYTSHRSIVTISVSSRIRESLHVPEVHAELPHGHGFFEYGHRTVAFGAAQQVHRVLFDLIVFDATATAAAHRRRPSSAGGPRHFRRRADVRTRVERSRRVERQCFGRRRPVHLAHFERVVAVLQQAVRRAVQLDVIACVQVKRDLVSICVYAYTTHMYT